MVMHYDVNRELRLACDAHSYMALRQSLTMDDGQERSTTYNFGYKELNQFVYV